MTNLKGKLYDYNEIELEKIQEFIYSEKSIRIKKRINYVLNGFQSIKKLYPITIHESWTYKNKSIQFDILCLEYQFSEREKLGDGEIGTPSRMSIFKSTTFWFLIENSVSIPKVIIEPIKPLDKLHQFIRRTEFPGSFIFNINYILDTENHQLMKMFLSDEIQKTFIKNKKIWIESSGGDTLIRDENSVNYNSFKRKFYFTKRFLEEING